MRMFGNPQGIHEEHVNLKDSSLALDQRFHTKDLYSSKYRINISAKQCIIYLREISFNAQICKKKKKKCKSNGGGQTLKL